MKVAIVLVVLCAIQYISAETCSSTGDCQNTSCDSTHTLECHNGQCTCAAGACSTVNDCSGSCRIFGRHGRWHCVDGHCRCFFV
ncbi:serine protease inhibitor Cvsi-2-like [Saccostrea cucullata]|uniref:serine protease inhibitor Cvsi-2-like n=1 Tax=Saccostrea cuccullata TaxID=36930 RepID=UPI002ED11BED